MADALQVEVVSADRIVWEGPATSVIARTTEGDIGILLGHEPLLAALVPCAAEVVGTDGTRYVMALDGGFISVSDNRVALLSQYARLANEIDPAVAQRELEQSRRKLEAGDTSVENLEEYQRAIAMIKATEKAGS